MNSLRTMTRNRRLDGPQLTVVLLLNNVRSTVPTYTSWPTAECTTYLVAMGKGRGTTIPFSMAMRSTAIIIRKFVISHHVIFTQNQYETFALYEKKSTAPCASSLRGVFVIHCLFHGTYLHIVANGRMHSMHVCHW